MAVFAAVNVRSRGNIIVPFANGLVQCIIGCDQSGSTAQHIVKTGTETAMTIRPIKNADEHVQSLRDDRNVYLDGERVDDVTSHPAFRNSVRTAANLYDFQADPANA